MSIVQWNPWRDLEERNARLFARTAGWPGSLTAASDWRPAVDITETGQDFRIAVEIPAVAIEDVDVSVKQGVLTVSGERKSESQSDERKQHRVERRWGKFSRTFRLPDNVDEDTIEARSRDGVLYLTIAKKQQAQPRRIEVTTH